MTINEAVTAYEALRQRKADCEAALKLVKQELKQAEKTLAHVLSEQGANSTRVDGITYTRVDKVMYNMSGDRSVVIATLRQHGVGELVQETVNAGTYQAYVREVVDNNGGAVPEWLDEITEHYIDTQISRHSN